LAALLRNLRRRFPNVLEIDVADDNFSTGLRETQRKRSSVALTRACHHGEAATEQTGRDGFRERHDDSFDI
jgi:hypothetical protein